MKLIPRAIEPQVRQRLDAQPAVVLLGPRQVGKTTLARRIADERHGAAIYLDLERPADLRRLDDADAYLRAQQGSTSGRDTSSTLEKSASLWVTASPPPRLHRSQRSWPPD